MQIEIKKMILRKNNFVGAGLPCPYDGVAETCLLLSFVFFVMCLIMPAHIFAQEVQQSLDQRTVTVHLEEAFEAKVSLIRFAGAAADYENPVGQIPGVKSGGTAVISVPGQYLPGEFVLRLDYRAKETDHPYPAERIIFLNRQNIELTVNPPYINNDERTRFQDGEKENTVYAAFMKETAEKRMPVDVLRQFLFAYDRTGSAVYDEAVKEFDQRRNDYNAWLRDQAAAHQGIFVSRLFQFQHIPAAQWKGDEKERVRSVLKNYFDGIDFSDPLVIRSRELARFMDIYMRMHGLLAESEEERDALFIEAGRTALDAAAYGHPDVRSWIAGYLRKGYEAENIEAGIEILE